MRNRTNKRVDCKNLISEDVSPYHGDIFDHPTYRYRCRLTGAEISFPNTRCVEGRCIEWVPDDVDGASENG